MDKGNQHIIQNISFCAPKTEKKQENLYQNPKNHRKTNSLHYKSMESLYPQKEPVKVNLKHPKDVIEQAPATMSKVLISFIVS